MSGDQRTNIHEFLVDQQICAASQVTGTMYCSERFCGGEAGDNDSTINGSKGVVLNNCFFSLGGSQQFFANAGDDVNLL